MAKLSLDDLRNIKDKYKDISSQRSGEYKKKIIVHMGTCGIAAGAREVLSAALDEISKRGVKDIAVTQSGCIGLCDREPIVTVVDKDQERKYELMNPDRIRKVINDHLINGNVVEPFLLK